MRGVRGLIVGLAALVMAAPRAAAQEFRPPESPASAPAVGLAVDIFGFSTRAGIDVSRRAEWVVGSTVDVAELWSSRVRLRPSLEVASDQAAGVTLHWAGEIVYRFQPDDAPAIPYLGVGLGHMSRCSGCTTVWPTVVLGFELGFRPGINWLIEYHALDRFGRHRFMIGLATRNAGGGP
jgi:hypothetical protein